MTAPLASNAAQSSRSSLTRDGLNPPTARYICALNPKLVPCIGCDSTSYSRCQRAAVSPTRDDQSLTATRPHQRSTPDSCCKTCIRSQSSGTRESASVVAIQLLPGKKKIKCSRHLGEPRPARKPEFARFTGDDGREQCIF